METSKKVAKLVTYMLLRNSGKVYLVKYRESPNPSRAGWWIPAPELKYGEHPEECAQRILRSMGINEAKVTFAGVDSFVTRDWHVLFHYIADTTETPTLGAEYECGEWFLLDELPLGKELAHGNWERELAIKLANV